MQKSSNILSCTPVVIPMVIGFATAMFCRPEKTAGSTVSFRPPSWVFSTVWPILYLLFGLSWFYSTTGPVRSRIGTTTIHIINAALTLMLALWLIVYGCGKNKKGAVFVLLACIALSFAVFAVNNVLGKVLIAPLMAWLIFALLLNIQEVNNDSE